MKLLYLFTYFLLFNQTYADKTYNLTSYYYDNNFCYGEANNTMFRLVSECNNTNICFPYTNYSVYNTCFEVITINYTSVVILTLLISLLIFIIYKSCCQYYLDNLCYTIKYNIESFFGCSEEINNYNSL
jgi:hypothetical protein